jgi:hypothetical protein
VDQRHQGATLPDQDIDTDTENKESRQEKPQRIVITLLTDCITKEKSTWSGAAPMDMAKSQMLASISLVKEAEGICRWMEKEVENRSRNRLKLDGKVLGYVA